VSGTGSEASVAAALHDVAGQLSAAGIAEARREARLLVAAALGTDLASVIGYPERCLDARQSARLAELASRRAAREPAARLLGRREFWSLDFALTPETLVPRPDSETLIEAVLAHLPQRQAALRILDLGTGSGCLLLGLLSELPQAGGVGVDLSPGAAAAARANAGLLGLADRASFFVGSWGDALCGAFDVIVANPPYVESGAIADLEPEVALYEPRLALDGGADGMEAYRALAPLLASLLTADGIVAVEVGLGQAEPVGALLETEGLSVSEVRSDLGRIARCLLAHRHSRGEDAKHRDGSPAKKTIGMLGFPV
jgi:release factor glutamine methyltransferase